MWSGTKRSATKLRKGDKLCSIMTEKLTNDLEAMHDGVLDSILCEAGSKANCGDVIGYIVEE